MLNSTVFNQADFISKHITKREASLCAADLAAHQEKLRARIDGKSVLVIGGAGTIGSSFIRALLHFKPRSLCVVDTNENGLAELTRDLRSGLQYHVPKAYVTYPMDFGAAVFEKMFRHQQGFDIVANFAAHKHVRSEKDHFSIEAMLENNVFKAKRLLDLLLAHPPQRYFSVSTDKAANPVNVMGASKKLMEEVILAYGAHFSVTTARFANVAFSNGSLLASYANRLALGQPLVAPTDVKRYFVSPEESGQICLLAAMLGKSGEVFFPQLKEEQMMTFATIAKAYLREHGLKIFTTESEKEARTQVQNMLKQQGYPLFLFSSNTSGEKPYEEFFTAEERVDLTRFSQLGVITNAFHRDLAALESLIENLREVFASTASKADVVAAFTGGQVHKISQQTL
ncbi:MAG: polysaccharide biosynthesis protein [Bacteroidota bacterium]